MIHICYNVNSKIFRGLLMSVMSIAKRSARPVYFHILSMDLSFRNPDWTPLSDEQLSVLDGAIKRYHPENRVECLDCGPLYKKYFAGGRNQMSTYTPYAMLRLFLDLLTLDGDPDKIIYVDADTMCLKDIGELWDIDISGYEFGAARDHLGKFWIDVEYCNSGVLYLNLAKVKETGLLEKVRRRVSRRTMFMPDQSALNDLVRYKLILPRRFNEQRAVREDTVIKHFCKVIKFYPFFFYIYNYKQWQKDKVHDKLNIHEFDDIFADVEELEKKHAIE